MPGLRPQAVRVLLCGIITQKWTSLRKPVGSSSDDSLNKLKFLACALGMCLSLGDVRWGGTILLGA